MTLHSIVGEPVPGEPKLWPPWAYVTLAVMTVGMVVALAVLARQNLHIREDRAAAAKVSSVARHVERLEAEVHALKGQVLINRADIEQIEPD